jgi:hypothetical protein
MFLIIFSRHNQLNRIHKHPSPWTFSPQLFAVSILLPKTAEPRISHPRVPVIIGISPAPSCLWGQRVRSRYQTGKILDCR